MLSRLIVILVYGVVLGIALMFSMALFAVLAIAALIFYGYFWYKTRALRQQIQKQMNNAKESQSHFYSSVEGANIIDGEATRLDEDSD